MANYNLYIDTFSGETVAGTDSLTRVGLPQFIQGDTISLRIYLLERTSTYPRGTAYQIINNSSLSLKVALGPKTGSSGSTLYTQQYTWSRDANSQYFYADFPMNTAAIATLLGTGASASAWFEVEYTQNGYPTTVLQKSVTVHAEVIETASLVTPAGETAATVEWVNATFLKGENTGFVLTNPTTGAKVQMYLGDDNTVHFDPIA